MLSKAAEGSIFRRELMKDDYVNIKYASSTCSKIAVGTSITYEGQTYKVMADYMPSYDIDADCFRYDIMFKAWYYELENKLIKLYQSTGTGSNATTGVISAQWSLYDTPAKYKELLEANGLTVSLDSALTSDTTMYACTFNGTNLLDAISAITKAFDPDTNYWEWWFEGTTLHIGKLGSAITTRTSLEVGTEIANVSVQEGTAKPISKLYAFSSNRNMSSRYGKTFGSIAATTAMYASEQTSGSVSRTPIGYYDPNHIVTGKMFASSARKVQKLSHHNTITFQSVTINESKPVTYLIFPHTKDNDVQNGSAEISFANEYLGLIFSKKETSTTAITIKATFAVVTKNSDGSYSDTAVIDTYEYSISGTSTTSSLKLNKTKFNTIANKDYILAIRFECNNTNGQTITITQNGNSSYEINSCNYAYNAGSLGVFNPKFYPLTDARSRCFTNSGTITGNSAAKGVNLVIGKLPKSWFANDSTPSFVTTEQRLCSVQGSGSIEGQVIFDDIYPSMAGTIGNDISIRSEEEKDTNGELTGRVLNYCTFHCDFLKDVDTDDFTENTAKIIFDNNALAGIEFELHVASTDSDGTTLCIIPKEDYNILIPCVGMMPASGDTYKIIGIDAAYYESADIIQQAQNVLDARAASYMKTMNANQNVYTCKIMPTVAVTTKPSFGSGVTLSDITLDTRVIGVQHPIDLPEADYQIICGNSPSYKRISALENKTLTLK